jgi:RHS repeat-associated protein
MHEHLTGLTNRSQSAILDAYQYEYDTATMISAITRNQQKMSFAYDKTYQLTAELGRYLTNAAGGSLASATVSNQFAYDDAGNRIQLCQILDGKARVDNYTHTADNQLTGIYWNAGKLTLRGIVQDCWTAHWVKVKQSTAATWVPAQLKLRKGQDVAWLATNVPVSGTGTLSFDIQAQITNNYVVTQTVSYTHSSNLPSFQSSIAYGYDANGNRIEKWTNNIFVARYFYDADNQLLGISFNNDQDYTDAGDYAYSYDPFGRRISATEDGVTRYFAYDGLDCIAELDSNANVKKWYLRGTGLGGGIGDVIAIQYPASSNQDQYLSYNHRGDVVTLTSKSAVLTARYEYTAFGLPVTCNLPPVTRSLAFSSKEYDTKSGLSYYGFRYYDADSGRWMTKEPSEWQYEIHMYRFVYNSPLNLIDIYGNQANTFNNVALDRGGVTVIKVDRFVGPLATLHSLPAPYNEPFASLRNFCRYEMPCLECETPVIITPLPIMRHGQALNMVTHIVKGRGSFVRLEFHTRDSLFYIYCSSVTIRFECREL